MKVQVTVLVENTAGGPRLLAEHGLAYWIDSGHRSDLFDTGEGIVLEGNAYKLGIPLHRADAIVLSHGHYDHTGGLAEAMRHNARCEVLAHPAILAKEFARNDDGAAKEVGIPYASERALGEHDGQFARTEKPTRVLGRLTATGPIPRATDFEDTGGPLFPDSQCRQPDPMTDDQALFFDMPQGTVVLLGCAHAGVINTLRYIRIVTGDHPIQAVLGARRAWNRQNDEGRSHGGISYDFALHGFVVTDHGALPADMVILAVGVRPTVKLAQQAGLEIGTTGAIKVDARMCTSDPDIYAAGDCVECVDLQTGQPCYVPLGSTANKQGRVAATNICGPSDTFPGVLGSIVCKVFDYCVGRTGLTEAAAVKLGYETVSALAPAPDKAHFMPGAKPLLLKLLADNKSRRLLGLQVTGSGVGDKRIDVAAMAIAGGMTVDQLAHADLCYAPPYASAMDNIAANVARNKLDGLMIGVSSPEVHQMMEQGADFVFLDVRSPAEYQQLRLPGSTLIPLGALRGRIDELPKDKQVITFCKVSLRGYEAALILEAAGFEKVRVMDGGIAMWPFEKESGS